MRHRRGFNRFPGAWRAWRALGVVAALTTPTLFAARPPPVETVFVIVLENHDWSDFKDSADAPYLNTVLLPMAAHCEKYYTPPGNHPSLPNYLWLEAGTNFGILENNVPAIHHQSTTNHLVSLLQRAGISWKSYQEDISGQYVPLGDTNQYGVRHNPFVYFDDVTGTNDPNNAYGIAHIRPYAEMAADLEANTVARYNFITPNLCHGGHDVCGPVSNAVRQTDNWLAGALPGILASPAYRHNGAVFLTWDEGAGTPGDGPIGMIVLSPLARAGYGDHALHTHGSLLRTLQEIFGVTPLLGDAVNARGLGDLFAPLVITEIRQVPDGGFQLTVTTSDPGRTNLVQASADLANWVSISTNNSSSNTFTVVDAGNGASDRRFYRVVQSP